MLTKTYLGDGVYADYSFAEGMIVLTTENGVATTDAIFLGPEVLRALDEYREQLAKTGLESNNREMI